MSFSARGRALLRTALRLAVVVLAAVLLVRLSHGLMTRVDALSPDATALRWSLLAGLLLAYALLIAVPFMPGVEIGLTMMALGGGAVAPLVYGATVLGLAAAYCTGRWLPYETICHTLEDLRLSRPAAFLRRVRPLSPDRRLALMRNRLPSWLRPLAGSGRYLLLAALINLPGSTLVGGGGGICLLAGLTRVYRPAATLLTIALAVLPLPLVAWMWWPGLPQP